MLELLMFLNYFLIIPSLVSSKFFTGLLINTFILLILNLLYSFSPVFNIVAPMMFCFMFASIFILIDILIGAYNERNKKD